MALKTVRNLLAFHPGASAFVVRRCYVHRDSFTASSVPILKLEKYPKDTNEYPLLLERPLRKSSFQKAMECHRSKVALIEHNDEFLYEDILRRSLDLAAILKDLFKYEDRSTDHKICFLCESGVSFVLTTLACWLSGNTAVPLSIHQSEEVAKHALSQNSGPFVLVTPDYQEKIRSIAKANNRQIVVLDSSWSENPDKKFKSEASQTSLFDENFYHGDRNAMILYTAGTSTGVPKPVSLSHYVLDARIKKTVDAWNLTEQDCTLHSIPMHSHFGIIDALFAPMSTGGKIVSLNSANPSKIWSHLLGIKMNSDQIISKANFFPSTPLTYCNLLKSHQDLFHNRKIREYVKSSCTKNIRSMVCGEGSIPTQTKSQWKGITGHTIVETYTKTEVGTVLCGDISKPELVTKYIKNFSVDFYTPLPGTEVRVVSFKDCNRDKYEVLYDKDSDEEENEGVVGELLLRNPEDHIEDADHDGWFSTGDIVRLKGGRIHIIGKMIKPSRKRFRNIERKFTQYSGIIDCYVFGMDAIPSGKTLSVAAALVICPNLEKSSLNSILSDCKNELDLTDTPSIFKTVPEIPLDSTGRVNKLQVAGMFFQDKTIPKLYFEDYIL